MIEFYDLVLYLLGTPAVGAAPFIIIIIVVVVVVGQVTQATRRLATG